MIKKSVAIGDPEIAEAISILTEYKQGKTNLEQRIVEDEQWYKLRHWDVIGADDPNRPHPTSAWLFNALMNKHADAMDNYPEPNILPREPDDAESAEILSAILPSIIERNGFEQTYSDNWWEKLKHGTSVYGVFWNQAAEGGMGDIDIRPIDLLNIFWEPGVRDLQESRNLFIVDIQEKQDLMLQYPNVGEIGGNAIEVAKYVYDDRVNTEKKVAVVDWYYKLREADGTTKLHYAKFAGSTLLFASQNDPSYEKGGWYDHGKYPLVFDTLYPEKGTPVGFGYIAITKDPQLYIDKLGQNILENSMMNTRKRFFLSDSTAINEEEFKDWTQPIVHVAGQLDDTRIREIETRPLDGIYVNVMQMKIDELKETSANRDFSAGGTASGVTAASAIAALQEAGNKSSRDMIAAAYRSYTAVNYLCIELMRQFYNETRSFRITGKQGVAYRRFSNAGLQGEAFGMGADGSEIYRKPIFDIKIKAQKKNPFSQMSQNELAKELYAAGFFNPDRAQESLIALELMEFEGKDKVTEYVKRGQTLSKVCEELRVALQARDQMGLNGVQEAV